MIQEPVPGEVKELLEQPAAQWHSGSSLNDQRPFVEGRPARALDRRHARPPGRGRRRRRAAAGQPCADLPRGEVPHPGRDRLRVPPGLRRGSVGRRRTLLEHARPAIPPSWLTSSKTCAPRARSSCIAEEAARQVPLPEVRHASFSPPASRARAACRERRSWPGSGSSSSPSGRRRWRCAG